MARVHRAAVIALPLLLAGCSSSVGGAAQSGDPAAIAAAAPTFTMTGSLQVGKAAFNSSTDCYGTGGYDDLRRGGQVTVYDRTGAVAGVGAIRKSEWDGTTRSCTLSWSIPDVPKGKGPYQYEVTHRGKLTITEADAIAGRAAGEIG